MNLPLEECNYGKFFSIVLSLCWTFSVSPVYENEAPRLCREFVNMHKTLEKIFVCAKQFVQIVLP